MNDSLENLDRSGLKAVIKEKDLSVVVVKEMTDGDIRAAIRRAMQGAGEKPAAIESREGHVMAAAVTPRSTPPSSAQQGTKKRVTYIVLGAFLGGLGIHNFYAGYKGRAIIQMLLTLLLGWTVVAPIGVMVWAIYEVCTIKKDASGNPFSMS